MEFGERGGKSCTKKRSGIRVFLSFHKGKFASFCQNVYIERIRIRRGFAGRIPWSLRTEDRMSRPVPNGRHAGDGGRRK